jgi:hypothetical protein
LPLQSVLPRMPRMQMLQATVAFLRKYNPPD